MLQQMRVADRACMGRDNDEVAVTCSIASAMLGCTLDNTALRMQAMQHNMTSTT